MRADPTLATAPASDPVEVLDLRHFSAAQLAPLLRDEAERWQRRLDWDYHRSVQVLLDYLEGRSLPGFVALRGGRILGYAFAVFEATKAVVGDVYAFGETEAVQNPVCDLLLDHLLEMLRAAPAVDRIEAQLLMFPSGALGQAWAAFGFEPFPRRFMLLDLGAAAAATPPPLPPGLVLQNWRPEFYDAAAGLIHASYAGHHDSRINDQYRSVTGAQRFLHNVIRFPGCGLFAPENSWVLRNPRSTALEGLLLCSRVRPDVGHITQLCVRPGSHGLGFGTHLLAQAIASLLAGNAHGLSLTVTESNTGALRLYERFGFATLHRFEAQVWEKPRR